MDKFSLGMLCAWVGVLAGMLLMSFGLRVDRTVRRVSDIPAKCEAGEQIIYTSAPKAEFYVCDAHWVRK